MVSIRSNALERFKSLLSDSFSVSLGDAVSSSAPLHCGIPQGSILRPILFSLFLLPLGFIFRKYGILFHCYAGDTQIYLPLKQNHTNSYFERLKDLKSWMALNFLTFNEAKIEVLIFGPCFACDASCLDLGSLEEY